jgi:hypothetical protein
MRHPARHAAEAGLKNSRFYLAQTRKKRRFTLTTEEIVKTSKLMKTKLYFAPRTTGYALALALLSTLTLQPSTVFAQGTAFTYQGRLQNNGSPASGTYNLTFSLFNTTTGSSNIDIGNVGLSTDTNIIRIGSGQTQTFNHCRFERTL